MAEKWLPPQAPTHPPEPSLPRAPGAMPRPPQDQPRRSSSQRSATVLGAVSVLVTLLSAGTGFLFGAILGSGGLWLGRRAGHRPAIVMGYVALALAIVAGIVWSVLATQGITPQDLEETLRRQR